jgi:outer membrane protein
MRQGIVDDITKIVNEKVKADNYDLVFDKSGMSLNGVPVVMNAKDAYEFTDAVVAGLNKNKGKEEPVLAPAPAAATPAAKPEATPKKAK